MCEGMTKENEKDTALLVVAALRPGHHDHGGAGFRSSVVVVTFSDCGVCRASTLRCAQAGGGRRRSAATI